MILVGALSLLHGKFGLNNFLRRGVMLGIGGKFLDLLYPPQCLGCDLWYSFGNDNYLCAVCRDSIVSSSLILSRSIDDIVVFSGFRYTSKIVARVVRALKYEHIFAAADICGQWLVPIFQRFPSDKTVFIPVPLHNSRLRERGFNQAELICRAAGDAVETRLLVRSTKTTSQALLSEEDRHKNVFGVFSAVNTCDSEVNYVVVDDVVTSGSTLRDCARALRGAGAQKIFGITVASTNSEEVVL